MPMLEVQNVHKSFGEREVLKGVGLTVEKGAVVAILGPSGSGKTTLLRCINFLEKADSGSLVFDGERWTWPMSPTPTSPGCAARRPLCSRATTCSATRPCCRT